jgi:hypothetical protein
VTLTFVVVSQLFGLFALSHHICPRGGRREVDPTIALKMVKRSVPRCVAGRAQERHGRCQNEQEHWRGLKRLALPSSSPNEFTGMRSAACF